jgi:hypothetical protein
MAYATEMTSTTNLWGFFTEGIEPRPPHGNLVSIPALVGVHGPRDLYADMLEIWSSADDLLRATMGEEALDLVIDGVDQTPRARAFAKLMQGLAWGQLSIVFDQGMVITEAEEIPGNIADARAFLVDEDEVLEAALGALDEAIDILQGNPDILFPERAAGSDQWFGAATSVGPTELIPFINTMAARFIVLNARTPAERAAVDWNRVLSYTANGLSTGGFEVVLDTDRNSVLINVIQSTAAICTSCFRWDNRLIGHADVSGAYQTWLGQGLSERNKFDIVTPDHRLTGANGTTDPGAYTIHPPAANNGCCLGSRPFYFRGAYQWRRHAHKLGLPDNQTGLDEGTVALATADENRLYEAEAFFHQGSLAQARDRVNVTRTRSRTLPDGNVYGGLPAATVDGAPHSAPGADDCVPRTNAGQCGDLHVVIWYERMIENAGLDAIRGYADSRAFGLLPEGSYIQLPVPAPELEGLELELYTFGGAGEPGGAVYAPVGAGWEGVP